MICPSAVAPGGNVNEKAGVAPNVTVAVDVSVMYASDVSPAPPMVRGRRFMLCTAGLPAGCDELSVAVSVAVLDAAGTVMPALMPPAIGPIDALAAEGPIGIDAVADPGSGAGDGVGVAAPPLGVTVDEAPLHPVAKAARRTIAPASEAKDETARCCMSER